MRIQHMRNATMIIEANDHVILIDPMIGPKGTMPPFAFIKSKPRRNPIVDFPESGKEVLERVTHCVITHQHPDHIDKAGIAFLKERQIPIACSILDQKAFLKKGLNVVQAVEYWKRSSFLGGEIEGIPARHGYGFVAKPAGNVMGFFIALPDQPSIYLSSDTIYTAYVKEVLNTYQPDISVVAAGSARFDFFKPLLMTMDDIISFSHDAPGQVIANHLEAVNHCPTSRKELNNQYEEEGLILKTFIPDDGEWMEFES